MAENKVKAWTYTHSGYPATLKQSDISVPSAPKLPSHILVRTRAAAINPVDIQLMNVPLWSLPMPPFNNTKAIGEDFSGTVIAAGSESGYKEGDEVFGISFWLGYGTISEVVPVDTKTAVVVKKPSSWSWEQAAALPLVWLTARTTIYHVEPDVQASKTKKLVVLGGSSSTGMYAVALARERGWNVMSTCSEKNVEFVKGMGADEVVDYTANSVPHRVRAFKPDAIIDCVGGTECLNLTKRYVTIVGDKTTRTSVGGALTYFWNPQMLLRWAVGKIGYGVRYDCVNIKYVNDWLEETLELPLDKIVIDSTYEFDQTKEAFERLNTGRARGKVVIKIGS